MRISDWSSDVCSSDLRADHVGAELAAGRLGDAEVAILEERPEARADEGAAVGMGDGEGLAAPHLVHGTSQLVCRSEEHTSELQSLMRISYAVFCLKKKKKLNILLNDTTSLHIETLNSNTCEPLM